MWPGRMFPVWELAGHSYGFITAIIRGLNLGGGSLSVGADTEKRNGCACLSPFCAISCRLAACMYLQILCISLGRSTVLGARSGN